MLLIRQIPFERLVREIGADVCRARNLDAFRWKPAALGSLQEAAEEYLTQLFKDANSCAIHAHRTSITVEDMTLARRIRGEKVDP
jgi:histone H3/H4